jgi:hypothetical protein
MRILFDQGTPEPLIPFLTGHTVTKAKDAGWERLVNGELLKAAETAGFEVLVTTDKNWFRRRIVPGNSQWRIAQRCVRRIAASVNAATPSSYAEVEIPFE